MKYIVITLCSFTCSICSAQNIDVKLAAAIKNLETDEQCKHAIMSLYVVDSKTSKVVFEKNAQIGLAPASCQKVVTSVSAFEMLGKDYKYNTSFINGNDRTTGQNDLLINGSGDPTFGSNRFSGTDDTTIFRTFYNNYKQKKIKGFRSVVVNNISFGNNAIPKGWVWEDIANYYGAGHYQLNWKENKYDLIFSSGYPGMLSKIINAESQHSNLVFNNEVISGKEGSSDNAYAYFVPLENTILLQGTIPPNKKNFSISAAMPDPPIFFLNDFENYFSDGEHLLPIRNKGQVGRMFNGHYTVFPDARPDIEFDTVYKYLSPPLDSINYWFLKKSINLYGEAFVKTIAYEKTKFGSTDSGIAIIKDFWSKRGVEKSALNIIDGSGLSPANRVTTNALVTVMQYAKQQKWFASFYYDLPEANGIKMKDGYINGVRSYTGYIKSQSGEEYTFSFIINNFDGNPGTVREKMWKVLDILK